MIVDVLVVKTEKNAMASAAKNASASDVNVGPKVVIALNAIVDQTNAALRALVQNAINKQTKGLILSLYFFDYISGRQTSDHWNCHDFFYYSITYNIFFFILISFN